MNKIFGLDSKFSRMMAVTWNLIILNLLTILFSIPLVTAGSAFTALHYCLLRMVRKEEGYTSRMFFSAFRDNLKQATAIWGIMASLFLSYYLDWKLMTGKTAHAVILTAAIVTFFLFQFSFPLLAHFENTISMTIRNSFTLCIARFPRTFVMAVVWVVPYEILKHSLMLFPLILLLGISLPAYVGARFYEPVFALLEPRETDSEA